MKRTIMEITEITNIGTIIPTAIATVLSLLSEF